MTARAFLFFCGVVHISIERPDIDYAKYLGPDWEKTYEGESTLINNHSSWMVIK